MGTGRTKSWNKIVRNLEEKSESVFVSPRFWWEKEGVFTSTQRKHLHPVSLSRIICDNSHITHVPADPFSRTERPEDMLACSHPLISHLDLSPWKEPDAGEEVEKEDMLISSCVFTSPRLEPI